MTQRRSNLAPRLLPVFLVATAFAASPPPSWFYAVSASADSANRIDARIVEAASDSPDTLVRFIRIAPLTSYCPRPIVQVKEIHARNSPLAGLTAKFNPCDIAPESLRASLKQYAKPGNGSDSPNFGFVARCAPSTVSFPIPAHESVDFAMLRREHPEWEHLWALTSGLREDASPSRDMFHTRFGEVDLTLQADASKLIPELRSGRFDAGLTLALAGSKIIPNTLSFRDLLRNYSGPADPIRAAEGIIPQLVDAQSWKFTNYTPPAYPPLALQARIQGQVELELTINPATGNVTAVKAISGHPILITNAAAAARTWQFFPQSTPPTLRLTLDFTIRCP